MVSWKQFCISCCAVCIAAFRAATQFNLAVKLSFPSPPVNTAIPQQEEQRERINPLSCCFQLKSINHFTFSLWALKRIYFRDSSSRLPLLLRYLINRGLKHVKETKVCCEFTFANWSGRKKLSLGLI